MASGYKKPAGTSSAYLEYWASRLLADTTGYTWWNLYMKDCTDKTITAPGLQAVLPASLLGFSGLNSRHSRRFRRF